jgi:hypothetical protein
MHSSDDVGDDSFEDPQSGHPEPDISVAHEVLDAGGQHWVYDAGDGYHGDIVGTPELDSHFHHHQTTDFTCGVVAQQGIINEFTGQDLSEADLVYEATANGWLTDHGTTPEDVGRLLEAHGVACHSMDHAHMSDIASELSVGHKVIVGVNSDELWNSQHPLHDFTTQAANHAIWVTGVDTTDPKHPTVIVNDSGDPDGRGHEYDLRSFVEAWQASGFSYTATDHAPPGLGARSEGFDEHAGIFTGMADFLSDCVPEFAAYVAATLVGAALGDMTGSSLADAAGFIVSNRLFDKALEHAGPHLSGSIAHDTLSTADRDALFKEI